MRYRELGETGLRVSEIGFGAWGIGGGLAEAQAYGPTDDGVSTLALKRAYDLGINFYDTSDLYGLGHSERLIGNTFKDVRHEVIIATKVGFLSGDGAQDFSPEYIEQSLDTSLARLQTDYVDLYHLHSPSLELLKTDNGVFSTLRSQQDKGKVRAIGISVRSPNDALTAASELGFKALQVNFNLLDQRVLGNGLFDVCRQQNAGIVARTPLCFGFLSGSYALDSKFDATDHRSNWSAEQITRWAQAYKLFSSELAESNGNTPAQIALRFCLSYPQISAAIPGMLTPTEVEENVRASELGAFSYGELQRMEQIYQKHTFFVG